MRNRHLVTQKWTFPSLFLLSVKKLTKFIGLIENFCNFILKEYSDNCLKVIIEYYKLMFSDIILIFKRLH